ncbi:hypothetical protein H1W37_17385 [Stappia taiwanensis]|uniref:Uncharacterized protein n=1 Tax=Stappia taiwanensis TaxID=992267 RepID=A0A838XUP0_9HYPH|nr:hypothetical protein [Stappia taiwanensis]MBA4613437.1 hypothetical protein [Stappia taiwanensis]GGF02306.1 hypothetical protein GCM10007285_32490 [Stappia taiwanensis]
MIHQSQMDLWAFAACGYWQKRGWVAGLRFFSEDIPGIVGALAKTADDLLAGVAVSLARFSRQVGMRALSSGRSGKAARRGSGGLLRNAS